MPLEAVIVLALAAFRATRLLTADSITANLRASLWSFTFTDDPQAGVLPRAAWRTYLYEGLTCPLCLGVWASAAMWALWRHGGEVGDALVVILAVAALQLIAVAFIEPRFEQE